MLDRQCQAECCSRPGVMRSLVDEVRKCVCGLVSFHQCRNIGTSLGAADRMALGQGSVRPRVSEGRRARKTRSEPGQSPGPRSCEPASRKEGRGLNGGVERWPGRKCSWEST